MEMIVVYSLLAVIALLYVMYVAYRLKQKIFRTKRKTVRLETAGPSLEKRLSEENVAGRGWRDCIPVPEADREHETTEPPIEKVSEGNVLCSDAITDFEKEVLANLFNEMDMENRNSVKGIEAFDEKQMYAEAFLNRKVGGARRQTYLDSFLYEELSKVLPVIAPGISVPVFVSNVLVKHLTQYRTLINEMYKEKTENLLSEWPE